MKSATLKAYKERVLRVLIHIQENLDQELELEELARLAHFSPYHFHRIFRGMLGESVKEHVRRLRLERAAIRLRQGTKSVTEIAFGAQYDSLEGFTRAFKSFFGCSPTVFRQESKAPPPVSSGVSFLDDRTVTDFRPVDSGGVDMDVKLKQMEPLRVAFVRHVGPYDQCSVAWDTLLTWLGKEGRLGGGCEFLGLCHDDPEVTPPEKIRYDACVTVDDGFVAEGEVGMQRIAGGQYAVTTHFGPYRNLGETYAQLLGQWIPRSGRALRSAPCLEFYLTDPESTEPQDLVTNIFVPLAPP